MFEHFSKGEKRIKALVQERIVLASPLPIVENTAVTFNLNISQKCPKDQGFIQ